MRGISASGIEKGDALPAALPRQSPRDAPCHQLVPVAVERRQNLQRLKRRRGVDLGVRLKHAVAVIESSESRTAKFTLNLVVGVRRFAKYILLPAEIECATCCD